MDKPKPGEEARPVLKNDEDLSEWQKEARKKSLENRQEGEEILEEGVAPEKKIGTALTGMANRLVEIARAYPIRGPMFDDLVAKIRANVEHEELIKAIEEAEKKFDEYANSGELDDEVMREVDSLLARAKSVVADHDHDHGEAGGDIHTAKQIELIDKYRGKDPVTKQRKGLELKQVNKQVKVGERAALDANVDAAKAPQEKFKAEIERIFGHPYDTNWWVPTVQAWAKQNQHVLGQYIKDRNAGKSEVH
jgi:hypothetical protein